MKIPSTAVCASAAATAMLSTCLLPYQTRAWSTNLHHQPHSLVSARHSMQRQFLSSSANLATNTNNNKNNGVLLKASVMAEDDTDLATVKAGTKSIEELEALLMAKGSVVSFFRGGLAAVRIDEDNMLDTSSTAGISSSAPTVLSPTEMPAVTKKNTKFTSDMGGDLVGHQVVFADGQKGVVVAHRAPIAFVYNGQDTFVEGQEGYVSLLKEMAIIKIRNDVKTVGWNGQATSSPPGSDSVDDRKINTEQQSSMERAMFAPIPQVKDIALINNPMLTGQTAVDVLAPIGQGQNMLLVADDLDAARGMICDFIATQTKLASTNKKKKATKFVYAAIDNSQDVVDKLIAAGVADDVHIVMSSSSSDRSNVEEVAKAAEATAMAATACAIAESYALEQGMNSVVIVDTLDQHKKLWDATTRVLVDVFGVDAVVKSDREGGASSEMRGFFSSIIQRSAQYKEKKGGGSVTLLLLCELPPLQGDDEDTIYAETDFEGSSEKVRARIQLLVSKGVPLTAANLRKIQIPIPSDSEGRRRLALQHIDDLISMSDGQIWLDETLRAAGQYPPIDPQRSVTRIGIGADTDSRADAPALRRVAEGLRLSLSQAANMDGAENTIASKKQVRTRNALLLAMYQKEGSGGRTLSESCTALLAASNGFLDEAVNSGNLAGTEDGQKLINDMLDHVRSVAPKAMLTIDESLDLSAETKKEILDAIESFVSSL